MILSRALPDEAWPLFCAEIEARIESARLDAAMNCEKTWTLFPRLRIPVVSVPSKIRFCVVCRAPFRYQSRHPKVRYCSKKCGAQKRVVARRVNTCPCGARIEVTQKRWEAGRGRTCSRQCRRLYGIHRDTAHKVMTRQTWRCVE